MTDRLLGCFRLGRELGAGGMGKVHAATVVDRCPGLDIGATVALKVVHPHLLEQPGFFRRFLREAEIGAAVRHPNVVRTYLADALGTEHFLVMEYVEGQTLRELLDELDSVPEELCRHVGREIAKGLAAIHAAGVVHRDLKPENVLITAEHVVKVMDLGVARLQDEAVRLSQTGAFVGSLQYAAPEAFRDGGEGMDGRADLHALGLLLYELACGTNPYLADDITQTLAKVLHEEPRRLGDVNPQLSPFFEEAVHTLLEKDREERFASAAALLSTLEEGESSAWWKARSSAIRAATNRPLRRIRIPRETAVYGREKDLARLRSLFEQAKAGDGQVVLIEGEAGIGKSRLVDELIGRLQEDAEDLNFLFGSYPPGGASTAGGGFSSAYREQFGEAGSAEHLPQTPLLVPAFDAALLGEPAPKDALALTEGSLATCFVHATRNLAHERPTVVLIDDLHFAPDDARALFMSLALAAPGHRVLVIGTMRPGVPRDWVANLSRLDHATHTELSRLGPKDLAALLKDSFQSQQLAEQLSFQISTKSDGNPFFAFEIIRGLREGQFITQADDGTWVGTQVIVDIQIPSSVLDLVNARVADLDDDERNLLDVAACWGFEFDPTLVGDALGLARIPTLRALAKIEKKHRLVRCAGERFVFDHHQVQEALYGALPPQLAREYHAAVAQALESCTNAAEADIASLDGALCVDLCEHYLKGARGEDALRYLVAAQTYLSTGYLYAQMVALSERALATPDLLVGVQRGKALLRLAIALDAIGSRSRQEECAREAVQLADEVGDQELALEALSALAWVLFRTYRHEESEGAYRRALELSVARGDEQKQAGAVGGLGIVCYSRGRFAEARAHQERSLAIFRAVGDPEGEAAAIGNLCIIDAAEGRRFDARANVERALAHYREIGSLRGEAMALGNLGNVLLTDGCLREARPHLERYLALSHEIGDRVGEACATGNLGSLIFHQGRLREARQLFERHLALSREIAYREGEVYALHNLGTLDGEEGEIARSEGRLATCLDICSEIGHDRVGAATHLVLGSLLASTNREDRARPVLMAARDRAEKVGSRGVETLARCELALLPDGDVQDALAASAQYDGQLSAIERRSARLLLWKATRRRAHLDEAKRLLDEFLAKNPPECHDSICQNLRVNREILTAWREEFGDEDGRA